MFLRDNGAQGSPKGGMMSCVAGGREPRTQEREQCGQGVEELLPKTGPWGNLDAGSIGVRPKVGGAYPQGGAHSSPTGSAHRGYPVESAVNVSQWERY